MEPLKKSGLCRSRGNFGILVVMAAVLVYIPVAGLLNSFGIFVEELNEQFCPTYCIQFLAWIGALTFGANRLFAWVTVTLQRVFPPLVLFLGGVLLAAGGLLASSYVQELGYLFATYCALFGVGSSLVMTAPYALIEEYFPLSHRYHLLATSIMNVGGPVGSLVMNPVAAYLDRVEEHTWRDTLVIMAVVTAVVGVFCSVFMRRPTPDPSQSDVAVTSPMPGGDRREYEVMEDDSSVDKDKAIYSVHDVINFALWILAILFLSFGIYIPKVHFIQYMTNLHISKEDAANCMSYEGLSEAVLSFLIALLGGGLQRHLVLMYAACALVLSVGSALLLLATRVIHVAVYVTVHGAADGLTLTVLYTAVSGLTRDITTKRYLWSATYFVNGLGQILGIPLAGLVFDHTQSYHLVFIIASGTFGTSMLLFFTLAYRQRHISPEVYDRDVTSTSEGTVVAKTDVIEPPAGACEDETPKFKKQDPETIPLAHNEAKDVKLSSEAVQGTG